MIRELTRKKDYLMLGFGIFAQAWYLFAYLTYDAQDYLLAFLSTVMLADRNGYLWKTLDPDRKEKYAGRCILLGIMYGILMLAKFAYYTNLLLTFLVLVLHLIRSDSDRRKLLWGKYLIIAGVAGAIFLARTGLDIHYYGFDKTQVKLEMEEKWCDYDKKPSTPVEEQNEAWRLRNKGYDLGEVFRYEPKWLVKSFRSMVSARITGEGEDIYYIAMAVLIAVIYVWIGYDLIRQRDTGVFIMCTALVIFGVLASIVFSYNYEVQPQGRYLLPLVIILCYMGSVAKGIWKSRVFKSVVLAASCMALSYYALFDSRKLIDLAYVRDMFG
jgi:hypothetical protein